MCDLLDLTERPILVTGASGGLGEATARVLARLGATVLCLGRNENRLDATLQSLEGKRHRKVVFDLDRVEDIPKMMEELSHQCLPIRGLVHLAGADETRPLRVCTAARFEGIYRVNVIAAAMLLKGLTQRNVVSVNGCSVVLVGSVMSVVGSVARSAYASSKAALLGLARSSALEFAGKGVRVNLVLPGYIRTAMTQKQQMLLTDEQAREIERMHPLGLGDPSDVAHAIAFLLSDSAKWITGSAIVVDGGYTAQ